MSAEKAAERQDELAVLYPVPRPVVIAGRLVQVKQLGLSSLVRLADVLDSAVIDLPAFLSSIEDDPATALTLIEAATDAPPDWAPALDPIDRLAVIVEITEVNEDAFRRALPLLDRLMTARMKVVHRANGDGPTPSTPSITADTSTPPNTPRPRPSASSKPLTVLNDALGANV